MTGSQRTESLITVNPQGSYLTLGEPQFPPLPNGAIRTSLLGLLWGGVAIGRIHSMATKTLGMHPCVASNLGALSHLLLASTL